MFKVIFYSLVIIFMARFCNECVNPALEMPQVWNDLKAYKVKPIINRAPMDPELLSRAKELHEAADTPESHALLALVSVWSNKWHFRAKKWNRMQYKTDDELTRNALRRAVNSPVAMLARAWLTSNACTLMPEDNSEREVICAEALQSYQVFRKTDEEIEPWLRFEGLWTETQFLNRYREQFADEIDEDAFLERTHSVCDQGLNILASAPVNDAQLLGQCAVAMAASKRWSDYFEISRLHMRKKNGNKDSWHRAVREVFKNADPECRNLKTVKKHRLKKKLPLPTIYRNGNDAFCIVAGYLALHCYEFGVDIVKEYRRGDQQDWAGLTAFALEDLNLTGGHAVCAYTNERHDPAQMKSLFQQPLNPKNRPTRSTRSGKAQRPFGAPTFDNAFGAPSSNSPTKSSGGFDFGALQEEVEAEAEAEPEVIWED